MLLLLIRRSWRSARKEITRSEMRRTTARLSSIRQVRSFAIAPGRAGLAQNRRSRMLAIRAVRSPLLANNYTPAAGTDDFEYNGHQLSRLKDRLFVLSEPEHAARRRAPHAIAARIEPASAIASNSPVPTCRHDDNGLRRRTKTPGPPTRCVHQAGRFGFPGDPASRSDLTPQLQIDQPT